MTCYEYFPILYSEVTRQEMIDFVAEFRKTAWCQMHIEGNFYQKEAEKLFDLSMKKLKSKLKNRFSREFQYRGREIKFSNPLYSEGQKLSRWWFFKI